MTGLFIAFEGGDGVGKSTQAALLVEALKSTGREIVQTYEPGDTLVGAMIRAILLSRETGELSPKAETLLYAADKANHLQQVVLPALERGAIVICDRYIDSMIAYQGSGREIDFAEVESIARWATGGLLPDLTVVLDLDVAQALGQIEEPDRLESAGHEFHARVREHFLTLAKNDPGRYLVIPARLPLAEIAALIYERVQELILRAS